MHSSMGLVELRLGFMVYGDPLFCADKAQVIQENRKGSNAFRVFCFYRGVMMQGYSLAFGV